MQKSISYMINYMKKKNTQILINTLLNNMKYQNDVRKKKKYIK